MQQGGGGGGGPLAQLMQQFQQRQQQQGGQPGGGGMLSQLFGQGGAGQPPQLGGQGGMFQDVLPKLQPPQLPQPSASAAVQPPVGGGRGGPLFGGPGQPGVADPRQKPQGFMGRVGGMLQDPKFMEQFQQGQQQQQQPGLFQQVLARSPGVRQIDPRQTPGGKPFRGGFGGLFG